MRIFPSPKISIMQGPGVVGILQNISISESMIQGSSDDLAVLPSTQLYVTLFAAITQPIQA